MVTHHVPTSQHHDSERFVQTPPAPLHSLSLNRDDSWVLRAGKSLHHIHPSLSLSRSLATIIFNTYAIVMDPNPKTFPILSYVMAKFPSIGPKRAADAEFDIEQPPPPSDEAKEPLFDLSERMPQLADPKVIAAMRSAVSEVSQARSVLKTLGDRPDHEAVDTARARLSEIEVELLAQLDEIQLSPRPVTDVDRKEEERKKEVEKKRDEYKAVISLDEMHEAYGKMLSEAEAKLMRIYEAAVAGHDVEEEAKEVAQEEVNEEVLEILEQAFEKGMERIDLSGRQLQLLPEAFGRLRGLIVLNLSSNQLQEIPDSIGGLESLEELRLSSNILESLPDSIGMLLNLKILDVSGNKLVALPDSICHCRSLVELDASFNRLTYLPTNIGYELVNLVRLSIHLNKIRSLPTSVGEMRSLRTLDVHFNELRGLPNSIGRLTNLEILNLGSNFSDLKELPNTIGNLTNLKELDLNNNQIHALPDTFGRLENLAKLNLDENPLVVPPVEIVKEGVAAVKEYMAKRWLEILEDEELRSTLDVDQNRQNSWLTRSTSWLNNVVSGVSEYLGSPRSSADPYLNEQR